MPDEERQKFYTHVDERFDELDRRLDRLAETKQDKFPKGSVIGLTATIIGQLILLAFIWGQSAERLSDATADRYHGDDAARDFALRDQRMNTLETDIMKNEVTLKELRQRIRALEAHVAVDEQG